MIDKYRRLVLAGNKYNIFNELNTDVFNSDSANLSLIKDVVQDPTIGPYIQSCILKLRDSMRNSSAEIDPNISLGINAFLYWSNRKLDQGIIEMIISNDFPYSTRGGFHYSDAERMTKVLKSLSYFLYKDSDTLLNKIFDHYRVEVSRKPMILATTRIEFIEIKYEEVKINIYEFWDLFISKKAIREHKLNQLV